jgi:hypothetical protein
MQPMYKLYAGAHKCLNLWVLQNQVCATVVGGHSALPGGLIRFGQARLLEFGVKLQPITPVVVQMEDGAEVAAIDAGADLPRILSRMKDVSKKRRKVRSAHPDVRLDIVVKGALLRSTVRTCGSGERTRLSVSAEESLRAFYVIFSRGTAGYVVSVLPGCLLSALYLPSPIYFFFDLMDQVFRAVSNSLAGC